MRDHEIIELVITTVCDYYKVRWQDVVIVKMKRRSEYTNERLLARRLCFHLLYMFTSEDAACETMNYAKNHCYGISRLVMQQQQSEYDEIRAIIYQKTAA